VTKTQVEYIEFMNLQATKGLALKALAARLKIPISSMVAFGDGYNDKSMMETAGFSIAMANAVDEIKAIADYVTTSNDDDGIATAVEKMLF
ncbi:MAG: HAD hydrolase family protein, partial [Candidatus Poribacteria bacterium]|nr:HAD hydrolase family protein [Candidatus Poribacteria bacterium]